MRTLLQLATILCVMLTGVGCTGPAVLHSNKPALPRAPGHVVLANYRLPKKIILLSVKGNQNTVKDSTAFRVEFTETVVGDPARVYQLTYDPSISAADDLSVKQDKSLLKEVVVTAEDQSAQILIDLAKGLSLAATVAPRLRIAAAGPDSASTELLNLAFDPTSQASVDSAQAILGDDFSLTVDPPALRGPQLDRVALPEVCPHSICYRVPRGVIVTLKVKSTGIVEQKTFELPNNTVVTGVDVDRSLFVKRQRKLTFTEGMLVESTEIKPSEAAAAAKLPYELVKAILSSINEGLGELTGLSTANDRALKAKAAELETAQTLSATAFEIEKQKLDIEKQRKALTTGASTGL